MYVLFIPSASSSLHFLECKMYMNDAVYVPILCTKNDEHVKAKKENELVEVLGLFEYRFL